MLTWEDFMLAAKVPNNVVAKRRTRMFCPAFIDQPIRDGDTAATPVRQVQVFTGQNDAYWLL